MGPERGRRPAAASSQSSTVTAKTASVDHVPSILWLRGRWVRSGLAACVAPSSRPRGVRVYRVCMMCM